MKDDVYIELLKDARKRLQSGSGMSYDEFKGDYFKSKGINTNPQRLYLEIYDAVRIIENENFDMKLDAYFQLLEYEELKQAREDSQEARKEALNAIKWARIAIWVAIGLGLVEILIETIN